MRQPPYGGAGADAVGAASGPRTSPGGFGEGSLWKLRSSIALCCRPRARRWH